MLGFVAKFSLYNVYHMFLALVRRKARSVGAETVEYVKCHHARRVRREKAKYISVSSARFWQHKTYIRSRESLNN